MIADALILIAGAAVAYAWLCAVVAPIGIAVTHLIDTRGGRRAWTILLLAAGGGALWTLIVGAFTMLATVLVPDAAIAVLLSPVTIPAMSFGVVVWSVETVATARVPRIGPAFELETALAPLSVVAGEAVVLAAEREYGAFLIDEAPWEVRQPDAALAASGAIRRVRRDGLTDRRRAAPA